jgi:RHS repeat-associated protein
MKKKFLIIQFIVSLGFMDSIAQTMTAGKNAIMEQTPREAMTTLTGSTYKTLQSSIGYFDGLGRPSLTVVYRGSADASKDLITSTSQYDIFGRNYKNILPVASNSSTGDFSTQSEALAKTFYNDQNPFTEVTLFENSPMNRPLKSYGVGENWRTNSKFVESKYLIANSGVVLLFNVTSTGATLAGTYEANQLTKNVLVSEQGNEVVEYKDKDGKIIQRDVQDGVGTYLSVLFIYDDFDRLRYVIQPKALIKFGNTPLLQSFSEGDAIFKEGIFGYVYDKQSRIIEKKIAGAGTHFYVYDKNDRVVVHADETDKANDYWQFNKYDIFGRILSQGLIKNIGSLTRSQIQTDFDNFANVSTNIIYEERGTTLLGYTNRSFPSSYAPSEPNTKLVTYYDNYTWNSDVAYNFQAANAFHAQSDAKGLVTGTLKKNLRTGTWQKNISYYDYKNRNIQNWHFTNRGNLIRKDFQYRFNGELLKVRIEKKNGTNVLSTKVITYEYDHEGRKIKYKYLLNGNERTVAKYEHDDIGRMKLKAYSPSMPTGTKQTGAWLDNATWFTGSYPTLSDQVTINSGHTVTIPSGNLANAGMLIDNGTLQNNGTLNLGNVKPSTTTLSLFSYQYHIRGGLKGINLDASGNLTNNIFSYRLDYETGSNGYFDGNINKQSWKSNIDGKERSFTFTYDPASRIKSSTYYSDQVGEDYALNNVTYDKSGNITNLSRNGLKSNSTFGLIDNLNYTYDTNSNKILKVDDASSEPASFRDVAGNDYTYWQDGSLRSDNNKDITNISYNYLKLPEEITLSGSRWIRYDYDAEGMKLKKTLSTGKYIDYEEDEIYENGNLYQTDNDEGRLVNDVYEYDIKDHLGNTRVSFKDNNGNAQITQVNHVGAWGEPLESLNYVNTPKVNNFTLSTYEKENDFGISVFDAHARIYDPTTPRMWQQDIMSESFAFLSPYNFNANNALKYIDPDGNYITISYEDENGKTQTLRYNYGMQYKGNNDFVKTAITALNYLIDNSVDKEKTVKTLADAKDFEWEIHKGSSGNKPTDGNNTISSSTSWLPTQAYVDDNQNTHAPIGGLLHEAGHAMVAYEDDQLGKEASKRRKKGDFQGAKQVEKLLDKRNDYFSDRSYDPKGWQGYGEYSVITSLENPFITKVLKEQPRTSHRGKTYPTTSPYSKKPITGNVPFYKPK